MSSSSEYVRASYIIPPPSTPPPKLILPPLGTNRNGSIRPVLMFPPSTHKPGKKQPKSSGVRPHGHHPRHRLGVSSLVLDSSTRLQGKEYPQGLLYSGGRDGQIIAWDLSLKTRKRRQPAAYPKNGFAYPKDRWEVLTGWNDDTTDNEDEEEVAEMDGDVLGDVVNASATRTRKAAQLLESARSEQDWELDPDVTRTQLPAFRQSIQIHNDWINDIILCNVNQTSSFSSSFFLGNRILTCIPTVISASSDGSIRAWSPHAAVPTDPALIGVHDDYVRCLAARYVSLSSSLVRYLSFFLVHTNLGSPLDHSIEL